MFPCGVRIATRLCSSEHYARIRQIIYANATIKTIHKSKTEKYNRTWLYFSWLLRKKN